MLRFRFTLIAVCLLLLFLGGNDLLLWRNNQSPQPVSIGDLESYGPPREWLQVEGGIQDLDRAISTSGSLEMEALLIPLLSEEGQTEIRVLVETRDPRLMHLFREYHFLTESLPEKQAFRERFAKEFQGQRDITGMLVSGLIAKGNRQKLLELAQQTGLEVSADVVLFSEGKEPERWRGVFFAAVGLLGLVRVASLKRKAATPVI